MLGVWVAIAVVVVAGVLVARLSPQRLPGGGALMTAATRGTIRRTVVVLLWTWLGWHAFAR